MSIRPALPENFELLSSLRGLGQNCHYKISVGDVRYNVGTIEPTNQELAKTPNDLRSRPIEFISQVIE